MHVTATSGTAKIAWSACWRYESLGVMVWALGFMDDSGRPDTVVYMDQDWDDISTDT